jgi:DeoR/GlpR family transcriptional regulator of sugar metabolism
MRFCERHEKIIEILNERSSVTVQFLADKLFVSLPTVRRDLSYLEKQNRLRRTFGGAVLNNNISEVPFELRNSVDTKIKDELALRASKLIKDDMVIFLDASSTVLRLVPYLKNYKNLTIITNSPKVNLELAELNVKSFSTGGILLKNSKAYVGNFAEEFVKRFNADICFLSCRGMSEDGMLNDGSIEESNLRIAMINNSKRSVFIMSSNKLNKTYCFNIIHSKNVELICDKNVDFAT